MEGREGRGGEGYLIYTHTYIKCLSLSLSRYGFLGLNWHPWRFVGRVGKA